jgi:hypothetical protein
MDREDLQEAWDLIADYLIELGNARGDIAHSFFIDSSTNYNYLTLSAPCGDVLLESSRKVDDME